MSMTLHFLNVGNGDCTIIELPDGNVMMVDICNGGGTNRALTDPVAVLGTRRELVRYIQTHPDMDHLDGLAALAAKCKISNFWDTNNNKPRPDFTSRFRCLLTLFSLLALLSAGLSIWAIFARPDKILLFVLLLLLYALSAWLSYGRCKKRSENFARTVFNLFVGGTAAKPSD